MERIPETEVLARLRSENPWWEKPHRIPDFLLVLRRRKYFDPLFHLVQSRSPRRALVLLGPRRVGKTVLLYQCVQALLEQGVPPRRIAYVSVDHPIYNGLRLDELLGLVWRAAQWPDAEFGYVFFDEIQYLRDWERHLKVLVDDNPELKIVVSGSAAAALRLKSQESGAGRFTDFLLPPLTFREQLILKEESSLIRGTMRVDSGDPRPILDDLDASDIAQLNSSFISYINFGGYPEVLFSEQVQADMHRFIKSDIVDKVLLRDLPGLYGIADIQELNSLFTTLAYNTGAEVSLDELSKNSSVAKNTIKKYIEYLEAAFLIRVVHRINQRGRRFQRASHFKVYLTNVSMRTALFAQVGAGDDAIGRLVETAIFAQWFHDRMPLFYARWERGEVDMVACPGGAAQWAVEVKWSDRVLDHPDELRHAVEFCRHNSLPQLIVTTQTARGTHEINGVTVRFIPASVLACAGGMATSLLQSLETLFPPPGGGHRPPPTA
jgi:predicted AAA+ superfamily ATPase